MNVTEQATLLSTLISSVTTTDRKLALLADLSSWSTATLANRFQDVVKVLEVSTSTQSNLL